MTTDPSSTGNRREFLTGKALRSAVERAGDALADELTAAAEVPTVPAAGHTVRLSTRAMALRFPDWRLQLTWSSNRCNAPANGLRVRFRKAAATHSSPASGISWPNCWRPRTKLATRPDGYPI